jgi:hypothetical protein
MKFVSGGHYIHPLRTAFQRLEITAGAHVCPVTNPARPSAPLILGELKRGLQSIYREDQFPCSDTAGLQVRGC